MRADYIIKNGHVIDPAAHFDGIKDIYVKNNKIVDAGSQPVECGANQIIDASGKLIAPGLIDFHTHIFYSGSTICIRPDLMIPLGTTATVDAGSAGCANFGAFYQSVVSQSMVKIKSFMEVYSGGQIDPKLCEDFNPALYNRDRIESVYEQYKNQLLGLKIRFSKGVVPEDSGTTYIEKAIDLCKSLEDRIGQAVRLCIHTTNSPVPAGELANCLRSGDIYCHCYQGAGNTIISKSGKIEEDILKARERGVIFDAANGKGNFGLQTARDALREGFLPDIISSDLTTDKFNMPPYDKNLLHVMGKYRELGLDLPTIIKAVTETPAAIMGLAGKIGTLKAGAFADVAVFDEKDIEYTQKDFCDDKITCHKVLVPQLVMISGAIAYCKPDFYI
ncbi:MAG: amidohydrolase family protein [Acidaminococcus sp.]|nr:amidohydrolase family protein [Acidaminococcus sp.]MCI2099592.1 amidohydrolase family protein [Acidaminococcus sp.]MCI2113677.1 amidohydrolase family protein [Acidaminococcus sp.]MCI2115760.1 amidohydrolase family protein [Acidaminococcus sp.]